ncbi:hypothetical protein HYH03_010292 [Edaphochlamys debaryana]|uniref:Uncharacterized protein n=1 Tax=Edaphochlamys debaryana TaxID=47281 RepID=A0A835XZH8_9CHLO|nr:hypothetical protein HYH03_010292 [Edaphochlamys debaryana]|eukprot:KAG2491286.1 hypothetical protein HYH03_010292 [Edaphochlamys debaryana]
MEPQAEEAMWNHFGQWNSTWAPGTNHPNLTDAGNIAFKAVVDFARELELRAAGSDVFVRDTYPFYNISDPNSKRGRTSAFYFASSGIDVFACARLVTPIYRDGNVKVPEDYYEYADDLDIGSPSALVDYINTRDASLTAAVFNGCPAKLHDTTYDYTYYMGCARSSYSFSCTSDPPVPPAPTTPPSSETTCKVRNLSPRQLCLKWQLWVTPTSDMTQADEDLLWKYWGQFNTTTAPDAAKLTTPGITAFKAIRDHIRELEAAGEGVLVPDAFPFYDILNPTAPPTRSAFYLASQGAFMQACASLYDTARDPRIATLQDYYDYPSDLDIGTPSAVVEALNAEAPSLTATVFGCPPKQDGFQIFDYTYSMGCAWAYYSSDCHRSPPPPARKTSSSPESPATTCKVRDADPYEFCLRWTLWFSPGSMEPEAEEAMWNHFGQWNSTWAPGTNHPNLTDAGNIAFKAVVDFARKLESMAAGSDVFVRDTYPFHNILDPTRPPSTSAFYFASSGIDIYACARLEEPIYHDGNVKVPEDYDEYADDLDIGSPSALVDYINTRDASLTAAVFNGCPAKLHDTTYDYTYYMGCARSSYSFSCASDPPVPPAPATPPQPEDSCNMRALNPRQLCLKWQLWISEEDLLDTYFGHFNTTTAPDVTSLTAQGITAFKAIRDHIRELEAIGEGVLVPDAFPFYDISNPTAPPTRSAFYLGAEGGYMRGCASLYDTARDPRIATLQDYYDYPSDLDLGTPSAVVEALNAEAPSLTATVFGCPPGSEWAQNVFEYTYSMGCAWATYGSDCYRAPPPPPPPARKRKSSRPPPRRKYFNLPRGILAPPPKSRKA